MFSAVICVMSLWKSDSLISWGAQGGPLLEYELGLEGKDSSGASSPADPAGTGTTAEDLESDPDETE
jgi:hypothetical protein